MVAPLDSKSVFDANDLSSLRRSAKENSPEALKAAARQFEAIFMGMMLKSMRDATPQDGPFNSEQTKMYTSMLDQQMSQTMAAKGVGLADVLVRQLSGNYGLPSTSTQPLAPEKKAAPNTNLPQMAPIPQQSSALTVRPSDNRPTHIQEFHQKVAASAAEASIATGIPAKFMIGQAALESGWGRRELKGANGEASHNLFGIKATGGWKGKTVTATTTEYIDGVPHKRQERFRAYDSYDEAFKDYASLLKNNPRYENVIANAKDASSFAHGLQKAGYATDPLYAVKLAKIIQS